MPTPSSDVNPLGLPPIVRNVIAALGAYALLGGSLTLLGWFWGIRRLTDWNNSGISMFANAAVACGCAGLALLLACVGLYGLMSFSVAGRTREIGVRMALGGQRRDVMRLVLREAMFLVALGLAIGVPLSLASSRFLQSFLFGVNGTDPLSLLVVILLLGSVAAVAGFLPARRAARVDPNVALRYE